MMAREVVRLDELVSMALMSPFVDVASILEGLIERDAVIDISGYEDRIASIVEEAIIRYVGEHSEELARVLSSERGREWLRRNILRLITCSR